ncbi:MAG: hypothetical protein RR521_10875 [Clostridia bacterium]
MKAITIFERCRSAEGDMRRIRQRIEQRREAAENITPKMDAIGGGHGTTEPDKIAAFVAAISELEAELQAREQEHRVETAAACILLDSLPGRVSMVLHLYYVRGVKPSAISSKMRFCESYIRKMKAEGEELLAGIAPANVDATLPTWYLREYPEKQR